MGIWLLFEVNFPFSLPYKDVGQKESPFSRAELKWQSSLIPSGTQPTVNLSLGSQERRGSETRDNAESVLGKAAGVFGCGPSARLT